MSGIAGVVNLDGAPMDGAVLAGMMEAIGFRGPDGRNTWTGDGASLGHTLLRTTEESIHERQPLSLDGKVWIAADARIDARQELIAGLRAGGHEVEAAVPDVELILRAWHVWGESCVEHLLGDFAFAIWDAGRKRLFCARDQMGVRPFFYACPGRRVIFSNTLDSIRRHPAVSGRLNDLAIADFLLFDANQDPATTVFAEIQRLPPAHTAVWDEHGLALRKYWTLPIEEPVFYRRQRDYVAHFQELLRTAVGDRLRVGRVGVFMSGGLDSPTLAATARELLRGRGGSDTVRAFTVSEPENAERHYAGLVAESLGIPIEIEDSLPGVDSQWYLQSLHTAEPMPWPTSLAWERAYYQRVARHSPVVFYGEGPDNALSYEWRPYLGHLFRRRHFGRMIHDLAIHAGIHRQVPIRALLRSVVPQKPKEYPQPPYPKWLNRELEHRYHLRARWERIRSAAADESHPVRPASYRSLTMSLWQELFSGYDAENTRACLEVRYPFLDLRLLRYLLRVPVLPWCRSKYLVRKSMEGLLPPEVLGRPKTPLFRNLWNERVLESGIPPLLPAEGLERYVEAAAVPAQPEGGEPYFWLDFRTRSLSFWLRNLNQ